MSQHLESADELTAAMAVRSPQEALDWFNDWLQRRDHIVDDLTTDDLATALEALAADLHGEVGKMSSECTAGLRLAASILTDSAHSVRAEQAIARRSRSGADRWKQAPSRSEYKHSLAALI